MNSNKKTAISLEILIIPCLRDNYAYLIRDMATGKTAVLDPSEGEPVLHALHHRGWPLDYVLNTHHHADHVGGNMRLKAETGCRVYGSAYDFHKGRLPGADGGLGEESGWVLGRSAARILAIPGHTLGHIAYYFPGADAAFVGDTLFSLGCGRLFEGTAEMMWRSLDRLRALPDHTQLYCGHEYSAANAAFALSLEPENAQVQKRARQIRQLRSRGHPTLPVTLADEKLTNPFLRADDPLLQKAIGLPSADPVEVFAALRHRKDRF